MKGDNGISNILDNLEFYQISQLARLQAAIEAEIQFRGRD